MTMANLTMKGWRRATALGALLAVASLASGTGAVAATPPAGTATTDLTAVDLTVDNLPDLVGQVNAVALDATTFASTDGDPARNTVGGGAPFALADLLPLRIAGEERGRTTARSDGNRDASVGTQSAEDDAGALGVEINPVQIQASAAAEQAEALVSAATGRVETLLGSLGIDLNVTGLRSTVDATAAEAVQGLQVGNFDIALGDLVPRDVLEQLPLDVLVSLLGQIPVGAAPDLNAIVDALTSASATVEGTVDALVATGDAVAEDLDELATAQSDLADAEAAEADAQAVLDAAEAAVAQIQEDLDTLLSVDDLTALELAALDPALIDELLAIISRYETECGLTDTSLTPAVIDELIECLGGSGGLLEQAQADADAAQADLDAASALVADLQAVVDGLVASVTDLVGTLVAQTEQLVADLQGLLAALTDLDANLADVLDALADGELLDIGALDVGVQARAAGTAQESSATLVCSTFEATVLGTSISSPDCSEPLTSASAAIANATSALQGVLTTLPVAGDVLPEVQLEAVTDVVRSVRQEGEYVVAQAGVTLLRLGLPSVTIDPAEIVDGLLDQLGADALGTVEGTLPDGTTLDGLGLSDLTAQIDGLSDELTAIGDLQGQVDTLLSTLSLGDLTESVATPGVSLVVDPVSTAEFRPGTAAGSPTDPGGSDPTASAEPPLPVTGGERPVLLLAALLLLTSSGIAVGRRWRAIRQ